MSGGISAQIEEKRIQQGGINVAYPQVTGLPDQEVQAQINQNIESLVNSMIAEQRKWPDEAGIDIFDMDGTYRVEVNKNSILSVYFENYIFPENAANGAYLARSITVDLETGKVYSLRDLFKPGTDYIITLNKIISEQLNERYSDYMIKEFEGITINQDYYLTPKNLVIYFQMYEYTSRPAGIPKIEIPYRKIINYINEDGPIGRLISDRSVTGN